MEKVLFGVLIGALIMYLGFTIQERTEPSIETKHYGLYVSEHYIYCPYCGERLVEE